MQGRNGRIDFIKGAAAFLVLWGHIIQYGITDYSFFEDPMYRMIYSFHMPVFMTISGYLFYKSFYRNKFTTLVRKKITGILYPGVIWGGYSGDSYCHKNLSLYQTHTCFHTWYVH